MTLGGVPFNPKRKLQREQPLPVPRPSQESKASCLPILVLVALTSTCFVCALMGMMVL